MVATGIPQITRLDWLSTTFNPADGVDGIAADIDAGLFAADDLLVYVQNNLDAFYWQSHSFSHLARDDLGVNDCLAEDAGKENFGLRKGRSLLGGRGRRWCRGVSGVTRGRTKSARLISASGPSCALVVPLAVASYTGNAQMAILLGLYDSPNYNWRSMTSPAITGLFNKYCLQAAADNLMKCYPGDNTYTLENNPPTVSLINEDNQFHSQTTTVATNGETCLLSSKANLESK